MREVSWLIRLFTHVKRNIQSKKQKTINSLIHSKNIETTLHINVFHTCWQTHLSHIYFRISATLFARIAILLFHYLSFINCTIMLLTFISALIQFSTFRRWKLLHVTLNAALSRSWSFLRSTKLAHTVFYEVHSL